MLTKEQIDNIAKVTATSNLSSSMVVSAVSEPIIDSGGDAALRITIVLTPGSTASISGDALLKTLAQIRDELQKQGDARFPIVDFATSDELDELAEASD
jgi:hypothetical protein